ncbi:hypothetical protein E8E12_005153 [Didymella heteroderae]|uniref:Uncharacterized protein n=1 Tax=Didymella heteroderae TaxID=1769908 RepID=A0A9P4WQ80_9PLEO|nr:hypothetical protein E8E12_005153 [Didymella heteroderae]
MYRRGDPRWNRTIQHISENIEHANEAAQENIYGFTQSYVNPCFATITNCCNAITAPCFPSSNDRRRNRARSRGRAELSFDFYDDWEEDENDGLLGWGNDNLERFLGTASNYGATQQPGRQRAMSYGQRARDPRFDANRRKSAVQAHSGQDPTIIPSSSYFGFLGRLPFKLGSKGLRYKPSAADLTEHPGALRRSIEEGQPLIEDSEEDHASDYKTHRRARSNTHTSGHTTDSFSSRGDIFPSEDELDDAVPLDDEFTIALERRTTGQWEDSANKSTGSGKNTRSNSKRPSRSASSRTVSSGRRSDEARESQKASSIIEEVDVPTLDELEREEERLRLDDEAELERKRATAQQLAVQRGLAPSDPSSARTRSRSRNGDAGSEAQMSEAQMTTVQDTVSPLLRSPASENLKTPEDIITVPFPAFEESISGMDEARRLESDSADGERPVTAVRRDDTEDFIPARLPHFG